MSKKDRKKGKKKDKKLEKGQKGRNSLGNGKGKKPKPKKGKGSGKSAKTPAYAEAEPSGSPNAADVAAYIVELAGPMRFSDLRNLVYLSYANHLAWEGRTLFDDDIRITRQGVAIPSLAHCCKSREVSGKDIDGKASRLSRGQKTSVAAVVAHHGCSAGGDELRREIATDGVWEAMGALRCAEWGDDEWEEALTAEPVEIYRVYANALDAAESSDGGIVWKVPGIRSPFAYIEPDYTKSAYKVVAEARRLDVELRPITESEYAELLDRQLDRARGALRALWMEGSADGGAGKKRKVSRP